MKIVVGMSGGVDSAVSAYLLKQQGHEVIGLFMRNWDSLLNNELNHETEEVCTQEQDYQDALKVAEQIGITLLRQDFVKEYWDNVFTYFLDEFQKNRTPNPDIFCNKYIKFAAFMDYAMKELKADKIAMGHYAQIKFDEITQEYKLLKGLDETKDQSYFLAQLNQDQLKNSLFPVGAMNKTEVRKIAMDNNLYVANKKDSTGICFIGDRNFKEFLSNYLPAQKGKTIDIKTNEVVGEHQGVYYYTIGQRKGIGLGGKEKPYFVVKKDAKTNTLYVANDNENGWLMHSNCTIDTVNWIPKDKPTNIECYAKFRYRQKDIKVNLVLNGDTGQVKSNEPIRAMTEGQLAVFYQGDECLGSGIITKIGE